MLQLKDLGKAENGHAEMENGRKGAEPEALDGEGFRGIAMDRSGRQATGSARSGVTRGKEVADKGRRSLLRRAERQEEYNAQGTSCQCLFSVQFERLGKALKGCGLLIHRGNHRDEARGPIVAAFALDMRYVTRYGAK